MNINDISLENSMTIEEVLKIIEKYKQKTLYVTNKRKLEAVISEGDIRRFLLKGGSINENIEKVKNYKPIYIYINQISDARNIMIQNKVGELPVLNLNGEIEYILMFAGKKITYDDKKINVPVVIMAGGLGTRLYPYTKILPKPLIPIGDTPITEHIIDKFKRYGCKNFFMILNHKKNMIKAYFDSVEKNYELAYVDETEPLGTGGGLSLLKGRIDEDFFFTNCDILISANYIDMYNYHKDNKNFITIVCAKKHEKIPYGVVKVESNNLYSGISEKPEYEFLINTGVYIVNRRVIEELEADQKIGFPDIIEKYRRQGQRIGVYSVKEEAFMDMGQIEKLQEMKSKIEG